MVNKKTQELLDEIGEKYSESILNWAIRKTSSRHEGEDLAQEVICQLFSSLSKGTEVEKLEPYIWKTAHYVWCNRLRSNKNEYGEMRFNDQLFCHSNTPGPAEQVCFNDQLRRMRRELADLSKRQREILISYYFDGLSVKETAQRLGITKGAVKWHLFSGRKNMKKEMVRVKKKTSYTYRPGRLRVALSGSAGPNPDTSKFKESLIKQNIALLCYDSDRTIDELVKYMGVPRTYLEPDIDWLIKRDFLKKEGNRYSTLFSIEDKKYMQKRGAVYDYYRNEYTDVILDYLKEKERDIRRIGFHLSDLPFSRMLWALIMLFTDALHEYSSATKEIFNKERPIRPDGGRYYPFGEDLSDGQKLNPDGFQHLEGWHSTNGMVRKHIKGDSNCICWLGIDNIIGTNEFVFVKSPNKQVGTAWHQLLTGLVTSPCDPDSYNKEEKELLAEAIKNGLVKKVNGKLEPQFLIFSYEQILTLKENIFKPIIVKLDPVINKMVDEFYALRSSSVFLKDRKYIECLIYIDIYKTNFYSMMFACEYGLLAVPKGKEGKDLVSLVMVYE